MGVCQGVGGAGALPSSSFKAKYLIPACKQLVSVCLFLFFFFLGCFLI